MSNDFYNLFVHSSDGNSVEVIADTLTASRILKLPNKTDTIATLGDISAAGGGTVTSVALALPNVFTVTGSPITTNGTLTATLASQAAATFFAAPTGASGLPTFRAIVVGDLPNIPTSKLTGVLADAQAPAGTVSSFFAINSASSGGRIYWDTTAGEFQLKNSTGASFTNLRVSNLFVEGTTTTVNSETVEIADNFILLNSNIGAVAPTEDAGIEIKRGSSPNSFISWDETTDKFKAGITTNLLEIGRKSTGTFTNASLVGNTITITHNLNTQYPVLLVIRGDGKPINFSYTATNATTLTIDMSRVSPLTGTWTWVCIG